MVRTSTKIKPDAYVSDKVQKILKQKNLWIRSKKTEERPVIKDKLKLGVSIIQTTEITGGPEGSFRIEGQRDRNPVIGFQWTYRFQGNDEKWTINAIRYDSRNRIYRANLKYGSKGTEEDSISQDRNFVKIFTWLKDENVHFPSWLGNFTTGNSKWKLITKPQCPSCDTPFCSC